MAGTTGKGGRDFELDRRLSAPEKHLAAVRQGGARFLSPTPCELELPPPGWGRFVGWVSARSSSGDAAKKR
jgi:hypothetical protein